MSLSIEDLLEMHIASMAQNQATLYVIAKTLGKTPALSQEILNEVDEMSTKIKSAILDTMPTITEKRSEAAGLLSKVITFAGLIATMEEVQKENQKKRRS